MCGRGRLRSGTHVCQHKGKLRVQLQASKGPALFARVSCTDLSHQVLADGTCAFPATTQALFEGATFALPAEADTDAVWRMTSLHHTVWFI